MSEREIKSMVVYNSLSACFDKHASTANSWAQDNGPSHKDKLEDDVFQYGIKDSANEIGQIARTNESLENHQIKLRKKKWESFLRNAVNDFYKNMISWSLDDFIDHGHAYRAWLNEEAQAAYDAGDIETGNRLSDLAHEFYIQEQSILNDPNLDEAEKKRQLKALWEDQEQALIEQFIQEYDTPASRSLLQEKNRAYRASIEKPDIDTTAHNNSITVPGLKT